MFPRVLVVTDRSEESEALVSCVRGLKSLGAEKVVLLYCFRLPDMPGLMKNVAEVVRPALEKQKVMLHDQGLDAEIHLAAGNPAEAIAHAALEHDASLIVLDEHPHGLLGETIFGFQATSVSRQTTRPVLIVRFRPCGDACSACEGTFPCQPLEHVLYTTDFSDNAERAFQVVEQMAQAGVPRITLMHVQDRDKVWEELAERKRDEFGAIDRNRLERLRDRLIAVGAHQVDIELPQGSPTREIIQRAGTSKASVIVMGSQGRGFFSEVFIGSVSHSVARSAPVSVLLVPAAR